MAFSTWVTVFAADRQFSFFSVLYSTSSASDATGIVTCSKLRNQNSSISSIFRHRTWKWKRSLAFLSPFVFICDEGHVIKTGRALSSSLRFLHCLFWSYLNFRTRINLTCNHWLEAPMENCERFMNVHVRVCACFLQVWTTWFLSLLEGFSSPLKFMWRLVGTCFFFLSGKC